jgi:hypothetical protein
VATIMPRTCIEVPWGTVTVACIALRCLITTYCTHVFNCASTHLAVEYYIFLHDIVIRAGFGEY